MTDKDRALAEEVAVEKAGGEAEVTDERLEQSLTMYRRFKNYTTDKLLTAKAKLREALRQCAEWAKAYDEESRQTFMESIKGLAEWVNSTASIEALEKRDWMVWNLHQELDPNTVRVTFTEDDIEADRF